ncbi:MBL fold metallo-hydrolase [Luteimonas gilva]|uniref:MBL fold metallo-hydrolase n=1 Tax=Luteimonas gilva TaxID=2572684 RepID=A0A4U5JWV8_9GAMM|nr:MBL fold metallo-hydrolase [Luteimonas gilva]TKR33636.1 MBL fold metallo-hydrolase [Luteimonas gilva]
MKTLVLLAALTIASALTACSRQAEAPAPETPPATAPAASAPVSDNSDAKTFALGAYSAIALRDGALEFANDGKTFGVGHKPEEVAALLTGAGLPTDKLDLSLQPLLVKTADKVLLFDTGAGTNMGASGGKLPASLAAAGVDPASVTDVFISHAHGDHVGGLVGADGALAFPNATIHISSPEWAFLAGMDAETASHVAIAAHPALVAAMKPKVAAFAPGADIIPGVIKAVQIKGHTPGHSGYLIVSNQDSLLYIGDAMHHAIVSVQKPDWTIAFDSDAPAAQASREELLARSADSGQRIYAVHFPFPGVGKIERRGGGFVWVPE